MAGFVITMSLRPYRGFGQAGSMTKKTLSIVIPIFPDFTALWGELAGAPDAEPRP